MYGKKGYFSPRKKQCRYDNIVMLIMRLFWEVYCYFLIRSSKVGLKDENAHCSCRIVCHSFSLILVGIDINLNRNNLFSMAVNYLHVI